MVEYIIDTRKDKEMFVKTCNEVDDKSKVVVADVEFNCYHIHGPSVIRVYVLNYTSNMGIVTKFVIVPDYSAVNKTVKDCFKDITNQCIANGLVDDVSYVAWFYSIPGNSTAEGTMLKGNVEQQYEATFDEPLSNTKFLEQYGFDVDGIIKVNDALKAKEDRKKLRYELLKEMNVLGKKGFMVGDGVLLSRTAITKLNNTKDGKKFLEDNNYPKMDALIVEMLSEDIIGLRTKDRIHKIGFRMEDKDDYLELWSRENCEIKHKEKYKELRDDSRI